VSLPDTKSSVAPGREGVRKLLKGFFVAFDYTEDAEREITDYFKREQRVIIPLTVKELLEGNFAHKLA
jgi:hypothetical protein